MWSSNLVFCHFLAIWLGKAVSCSYHLNMGITVPTCEFSVRIKQIQSACDSELVMRDKLRNFLFVYRQLEGRQHYCSEQSLRETKTQNLLHWLFIVTAHDLKCDLFWFFLIQEVYWFKCKSLSTSNFTRLDVSRVIFRFQKYSVVYFLYSRLHFCS